MTIPITSQLGQAVLGAMVLGSGAPSQSTPAPVLVTRPVAASLFTQTLGSDQAPPPPDVLNYVPGGTQ